MDKNDAPPPGGQTLPCQTLPWETLPWETMR